jgi:hypothetical protein
MLNLTDHAMIGCPADLKTHYERYLLVLNYRLFNMLTLFMARDLRVNDKPVRLVQFPAKVPKRATFCAEDIVVDLLGRTLAARIKVEIEREREHEHEHERGVEVDGVENQTEAEAETQSSEASGSESEFVAISISMPNIQDLPDCSSGAALKRYPSPNPGTGTSAESDTVTEFAFYRFDECWRITHIWSNLLTV